MTTAGLEAALGHRFARPDLLRQALTHRGYATPNNERLEFLGDSVLNCVIADLLYARVPDLREGTLHLIRVSLVRQDALAAIARRLGLGQHLLLDKNARLSGGTDSPAILSDAVEAIFGAVYLDGGFSAAHTLITALYAPEMAGIDPAAVGKDPKTQLQEVLQKRQLARPDYQLVATRGEEHAREFDVECVVAGTSLRTLGRGRSRRGAEQDAARQALEALGQ